MCDFFLAEVCMGRAPTPASDFWSLGAFLFEALCGKVSTGVLSVNSLDRRVIAGLYPQTCYTDIGVSLRLCILCSTVWCT